MFVTTIVETLNHELLNRDVKLNVLLVGIFISILLSQLCGGELIIVWQLAPYRSNFQKFLAVFRKKFSLKW